MTLSIWPNTLRTPQNKWVRILLIIGILCWMSIYPIYTSYYKANGMEQYERHKSHMAGESMFFNPWQYRVFSPLLVEGIYWVADHTVFYIIPIQGVDLNLPGNNFDKNPATQKLIKLLKEPEFVKYTIVFTAFRFIQNLLIICICFYYFSFFIKDRMLVILGMVLTTLFMGNEVVDADLTCNTYTDIIFYLLAAIVILKGLNPLWIVLLTFLGALNRETSLLIPVIYFFFNFSWRHWPSLTSLIQANVKTITITTFSLLLFLAAFLAVRNYYGYQPASFWRVGPGWPMLKLNLFSAVSIKTYMELFGIFAVFPLWALLSFKTMHKYLQFLFIVIVPVWMSIHLAAAIGYQTRLFLVPTLLVFIPAALENLEKGILSRKESSLL